VDTARQRQDEPQDPAQLLSDLTDRVPGVLHALVVSADGVPLAASDRLPPVHLDQLAAITSGLIGLAIGVATIADGGEITQALVVMERGTLVIMAIDASATLAVLAAAAGDLELIAYEMTMLVQHAAPVLTGDLDR
jgi:predicted regulator of Ras-like GTPase activity (Roadblock/LC7/MglB family)